MDIPEDSIDQQDIQIALEVVKSSELKVRTVSKLINQEDIYNNVMFIEKKRNSHKKG